jgi:hypothetical protein
MKYNKILNNYLLISHFYYYILHLINTVNASFNLQLLINLFHQESGKFFRNHKAINVGYTKITKHLGLIVV